MRIPEILEYVRSKGYEVSDRQFRLWADGIPLPEPTVIRGGRGHGNVKDYPPGTENMVVDLARWQAEGVRTYDALAWLAWLKQYPVPPGRMREIFRRAYAEVMAVHIDHLTPRDLALWVLWALCEIPKHKAGLMEIAEVASEYLIDEPVAVAAKSHPEYEAMLREKEMDENRPEISREIEKLFDSATKFHRDNPFVRMNFPEVQGFNMKSVLKLFFRFRLEYVLSNGIKGLIKLNIPDCIELISDDEINDVQRYVQPNTGTIDDILDDRDISQSFNFRDPVYSLFIPVIWGLSRIPELSEIWEWIDTEFIISEEPWFHKNPNKKSKQLINAIRWSRDILAPHEGYKLLLRKIYSM